MSSRFRSLRTLALVVAAGGAAAFLPGRSLAADEIRETLDGFSGEWEGELRVFALDGFLLKTFPARRSYSWDGAEQVVVTRFFDGSSDYEIEARLLVELGRLHSTVKRPNQPPEEYAGTLEAGSLVWTNTSNNKRDSTERIVVTNGVARLESTSSEIMRVKGVSGVVRVAGTFQRANSGTANGGATRAGATAFSERIANLERELAEAKKGLADAAQAGATASAEFARERDAWRDQIARLEQQRAALEARPDDAAAARAAQLEKTVAYLNAAVAASRATEDKHLEVAEQLRTELAARNAQLVRVQAEFETARSASASGAEQKQRVSSAQERELTDLRARIERSTSDLAAIQRQLEQARADLAASAKKTTDAEARATVAETAAKAHVADLQGQFEKARSSRDQAVAAAAKLTDQLAALRADLEKIRSGSSAESGRIKELERDLATAEDARRKQEDAARKLQAELAKATAGVAATRLELEHTQAESAGVAAQLAQVRSQADAVSRRAGDATVESARLATRVKELEATVAASEAAHRSSSATSGELERERSALREQVAKLQRDLTAAETARKTAEAGVARLTASAAELEKARSASSEAAARIQQLEKQAADASRRVGELLAEQKRSEETARAREEKDAAAVAEKLAAARAEATRLATRVTELESAVAAAGPGRSAIDASGGSGEREELRQQVATLLQVADVTKVELEQLRKERDLFSARIAELLSRPEANAETQQRLAAAEIAGRAAATKLAEVEKQLAAARVPAARLAPAAADTQAEAEKARRQTEQLQAERDLLSGRLAAANDTIKEIRAALAQAETAATEARRRAEAGAARLKQLETATAATAGARAEVEAQRALVAQRDQDLARLSTRINELSREREDFNVRIRELEQRLKTAAAGPAPAALAASGLGVELQDELTRSQRRATELESERNSMRDNQALLQSQLEQTRQLRDDTLARFQEVVVQLNAIREERDRLARANVSLQAELRAARGPGAPSPATPVAASEGGASFLDRLLDTTEKPKPAPSAAPPATVVVPPDRVIEQKIAALQVIGITHSAEEDKVILNGRLYRSGEMVDASMGLVFVRIDGDALVFTAANGHQFRRQF